MAIYTESKGNVGDLYPIGATETVTQYLQPIIDPEHLKMFHLFGIPLVSAIRDPITGRQQAMTDPILKGFIERAVALAESETQIAILPVQLKEKHPFDKCAYESFGYVQLRGKPVASVESITVTPANEEDIYTVPMEWVEGGNFSYGQVNVVPLTLAINSGTVVPTSATAGGALFLSIFGHKHWIPAFWKVVYTAGFPNGKVPGIINELIGTIAAMEILSVLGATYGRSSGASISMDGISESVSSPGPNIFQVRISELNDKRKNIVQKLRSAYGLKFISSNV